MGCDIHLYKEKCVDGKWTTADEWTAYDCGDDDKGIEVSWKNRFSDRNYQLFGLLSAGVREEHKFSFAPRGLPFDACAEIAKMSERYGVDGHSHSYLFLHELKAMSAFLDSQTIAVSGMKSTEELKALRASIATGNPDWSLLFPYCRSTNARDHEDFEIEVPASFYVGAGLKKIISGFDGIDGEN